ncbi:hypothetical protein PU634_04885 [Oceanimonas pelagia]|uniref:Uncharacterized protein n=1 Tax=Oceanimonas pelagia TaxID=3028314 RepID=A0AA50KRM6_9GAMM|nr:hypothetical protein [Oceanimonas pelagia]WMC11702.1 hypothetical protein PU634_04885 [Oceanimonas pelagia]
MIYTLRPYGGPHAGSLHHVVHAETGAVIRNATRLEVKLWRHCQALEKANRNLQAQLDDMTAERDELDMQLAQQSATSETAI